MTARFRTKAAPLAAALLLACTDESGGGKKLYAVDAVLDGDTFDLADGRRVRMLGIDAPERSSPEECWGDEAFNHLSGLLGDAKVELEYDVEREDAFGRTLAWVRADGVFLNAQMVDDGAACVLLIPPNGEEYGTYLESLESGAQAANRGLWGDCGSCDVAAVAGTGASK